MWAKWPTRGLNLKWVFSVLGNKNVGNSICSTRLIPEMLSGKWKNFTKVTCFILDWFIWGYTINLQCHGTKMAEILYTFVMWMRVTNLTEKGCSVTQARHVASKYARGERVPPALVSDGDSTVGSGYWDTILFGIKMILYAPFFIFIKQFGFWGKTI